MSGLSAVPDTDAGLFAGHTPGPWVVNDRQGSLWVYGPAGAPPMRPGERPATALAFNIEDRDLIAAAPDLLAIVRATAAILPGGAARHLTITGDKLTPGQVELLDRFLS